MTKTSNSHTFLLVREGPDTPWVQAVQQALSALGELQICSERDALDMVIVHSYDVVMVDAGSVENTTLVLSRLLANRPDLRIVVFTASPTWRRAREALRAGAVDYVRKLMNEKENQSFILSVLEAPRPLARQQSRRSTHAQDDNSLCRQ